MVKVRNWEELSKVKSDTHEIEINFHYGCANIKENGKFVTYLSTHTFYERDYKHSEKILKSFGFDVELESWG